MQDADQPGPPLIVIDLGVLGSAGTDPSERSGPFPLRRLLPRQRPDRRVVAAALALLVLATVAAAAPARRALTEVLSRTLGVGADFTVTRDRLYVTGSTGRTSWSLSAYELPSGRRLWTVSPPGPAGGSIISAAGDDVLLLGSTTRDGEWAATSAVDAATGRMRWTVPSAVRRVGTSDVASGWGRSSAIRTGDVSADEPTMVVLDLATGRRLWSVPATGAGLVALTSEPAAGQPAGPSAAGEPAAGQPAGQPAGPPAAGPPTTGQPGKGQPGKDPPAAGHLGNGKLASRMPGNRTAGNQKAGNGKAGNGKRRAGRPASGGAPAGTGAVLTEDGVAEVRDMRTGHVYRRVRLLAPGQQLVGPTFVGDGLVVLAYGGTNGSGFIAYDRDRLAYDGGRLAPRWQRPRVVGSEITECGRLLCVGDQNSVLAVDPATGLARWRLPGRWFLLAGGDLLLGGARGTDMRQSTALLDPDTGQVRTALTAWSAARPVADQPPVLWRSEFGGERGWLAQLTPAGALRILDSFPYRVSDCQLGRGAIVCRAAPGELRVWAYRD